MMKRLKFSFIFVFLLVFLSCSVFASDLKIDYNDSSTHDLEFGRTSTYTGQGANISVTSSFYPTWTILELKKSGSPSTNLQVRICTIPTGGGYNYSCILNSSTIDGSTLTTSYDWINFTFNGTYNLSIGEYELYVYPVEGTVDASNYYLWKSNYDGGGGSPYLTRWEADDKHTGWYARAFGHFQLYGVDELFVPSNFTITAFSNWTSSSLSSFNASIDGVDYGTTSGTITTGILTNSTSLYNITVYSSDRFNKTFLGYNVSSNLNVSLIQTQVNLSFLFSSGDLIVTPINLTRSDTGEFLNVSNGSIILFPDEGITNFSVRCDNNVFAPFNISLNLSALDNVSFNFTVNETQNIITFLDENTSSPISNATVVVGFPSGFELSLSTNSSGQINFSYIQNNSLEFGNYSYYFDKVGYVNITLSDFINASNIPHTRTYNLSRAKLNIFIYDRVTHNLLNNTNVSVAFIGLFNETTSTGSIIKDNLTIVGGDYLIYASAVDYKTSIRSLTFTNQEEFTLNFYLLNLSNPNAGTLFVTTKDSFFREVTGAKVDLLEYIPSSLSYVSVDSCVTNVDAQCSFAVELNTKVYYIRATATIGDTVFVAETSQNGEIFTVNNDNRDLIFFTRSTFTVNTVSNLVYSISESFLNNVSSISVDFFTNDGSAKEVCIEYFKKVDSSWVSVTGDTYCLESSSAIQNIDVDVTLNRSNDYEARIYVDEGFNNELKVYSYPSVSSTSGVFSDDLKGIIIIFLWIAILGYSLHQKNISLFFFLAIILSWVEIILFPVFTFVAISVFKTIVCSLSIYIGRKKQEFQ